MRAVFEDHDDCLFANAMKHDTNALHWPCMSLVILDGYKSIHVDVEAIMSGEFTEAYAWLIDVACEMTPNCSCDSI